MGRRPAVGETPPKQRRCSKSALYRAVNIFVCVGAALRRPQVLRGVFRRPRAAPTEKCKNRDRRGWFVCPGFLLLCAESLEVRKHPRMGCLGWVVTYQSLRGKKTRYRKRTFLSTAPSINPLEVRKHNNNLCTLTIPHPYMACQGQFIENLSK